MKKVLFFLLSAFISFQAYPQKIESSLLWEISGNGIKSSSYLFGTYHLMGKSFLDTLKGVTSCLDKAETVVAEVPLEDESVLLQKMMPFMTLEGSSLDKILTPGEYAEVDSFLRKRTPMQFSLLNGFKPLAVQLTLSTFIIPNNVSPDNPAMDMYLQAYARNKGKQLAGLETIEQQARLIFDIPLNRQKELLLKTVRETDRMIQEGTALFELYKAQNLSGIERAIDKSTDYSIPEMEALLINRNKAWIKQMPGMLNKGPVFFAVGAAHLVGENGLISLLRKQGYQLKAVSSK